MERRYLIMLNEPINEGDSVTADVLTVDGSKKNRRKQWRRYLSVRAGVVDYHECNRIAREMGYPELAG